jgi:ACS family tartrate transporter-like MFS transporter
LATTAIPTRLGEHTRHRIALRLLPYLFFLYVIAFLDRMNISTAALEMPHDLGFNDRVMGLGTGIFFLGYILLEIPGSVIVERWSARRWIARIMFSWGIVTIAMAFIRTPHQFYTVRFLLGLAEAGFFPGVIVYLTHWFIYEDRAKAVANFMAAIPLSYIVGSPVSGWLLGVHWLGIRGWRWLFIVEGIPALVFGVVTWFYLTDWPREAKWLRPEERDWISRQLEQEKQAKKSAHAYTIWQALRHRDVLTLTAAYLVDNLASFALSFWMPTMLKRISGLTNFRVALLVAVPYMVAVVAMQANGWHSDRTAERRWHTAIPLLVAAAALLPLSLAELGTTASVFLFSLALAGLLAFVPSFWAMPSAFLCGSAAAVSTGAINCAAVGLGGFAGPALLGYLVTRTHSFRSGFACLVGALIVAGLLTLTLRVRRPKPALTVA